MTLTVITIDGATESYDGRCEVEAGGVLKITPADDSKLIIRLSPMFWREIRESSPPEESPFVGGYRR
jgi:hypothetical protein